MNGLINYFEHYAPTKHCLINYNHSKSCCLLCIDYVCYQPFIKFFGVGLVLLFAAMPQISFNSFCRVASQFFSPVTKFLSDKQD